MKIGAEISNFVLELKKVYIIHIEHDCDFVINGIMSYFDALLSSIEYKIFNDRMKNHTPFSFLNYLSRSISGFKINNNFLSHWTTLKTLGITQIDSYSWTWSHVQNMDARFEENSTLVVFHPEFSSGTEIVLGNINFTKGNVYFWEIELLSPVYGTDMVLNL